MRPPATVISYAFAVTNSGNITLAGPVTISDDLTSDEACPAVSTVGNNDSNLDVGETITCSASYSVTQADIDNGSVDNTATASAAGTSSNPDSATATADQSPALALTKTGSLNDDDGIAGVSAGDTISYVFTVANTGNVTLTNITLSDPQVTVSGGPLQSGAGCQ